MKYLVTEDEFKSATVTEDGDLEFTRDNGVKVVAGRVRGADSTVPGPPGKDGSNVLPTQAAILQEITEDGPVKDQLNATIAEALSGAVQGRSGSDVVFDGDSITIGAIDAALQNRAASWTNALTRAAGGRIRYLYNAAVAGQTSSAALARFDQYVAPQNPDTVILTIGTNDIGQGLSLSLFQANIAAYHAKCVAIGARLIIGEIWPTSDDTGGRKATTAAWSEWIATWAISQSVQVIPWQKLADPVTGGWPTGWSTDGIHPNNPSTAATRIGLFGWEQIKHLFGEPVIARPAMNAQGLNKNSLFEAVMGSIAVTAGLSATPSTGAGALTAGLYAYRIAARTHYGEGAAAAPVVANLTATGQVALSWSGTVGNKGFHLYRRGPLDQDFRRIMTWDTNVTSYTDDGSATPGSARPLEVDASAIPFGFTPGFNKHYAEGFGRRVVSGIRGYVWRFPGMQDGTASAGFFEYGPIAPGDKVTVTGFVAGSGVSMLNWRWRSASGNLTVIRLVGDELIDEFGMFSHTMTAPDGVVAGRLYFEGAAAGYIDVGETYVTVGV